VELQRGLLRGPDHRGGLDVGRPWSGPPRSRPGVLAGCPAPDQYDVSPRAWARAAAYRPGRRAGATGSPARRAGNPRPGRAVRARTKAGRLTWGYQPAALASVPGTPASPWQFGRGPGPAGVHARSSGTRFRRRGARGAVPGADPDRHRDPAGPRPGARSGSPRCGLAGATPGANIKRDRLGRTRWSARWPATVPWHRRIPGPPRARAGRGGAHTGTRYFTATVTPTRLGIPWPYWVGPCRPRRGGVAAGPAARVRISPLGREPGRTSPPPPFGVAAAHAGHRGPGAVRGPGSWPPRPKNPSAAPGLPPACSFVHGRADRGGGRGSTATAAQVVAARILNGRLAAGWPTRRLEDNPKAAFPRGARAWYWPSSWARSPGR